MKNKQVVEKFQCPGCLFGSDTKCGSFSWSEQKKKCEKHIVGTVKNGLIKFALGMPTGFNIVKIGKSELNVSFFDSKNNPIVNSFYNHLNVPVWGMECDGFLFVRVYSPRIDDTFIHVIEDAKFSDLPKSTINVADFINDID